MTCEPTDVPQLNKNRALLARIPKPRSVCRLDKHHAGAAANSLARPLRWGTRSYEVSYAAFAAACSTRYELWLLSIDT